MPPSYWNRFFLLQCFIIKRKKKLDIYKYNRNLTKKMLALSLFRKYQEFHKIMVHTTNKKKKRKKWIKVLILNQVADTPSALLDSSVHWHSTIKSSMLLHDRSWWILSSFRIAQPDVVVNGRIMSSGIETQLFLNIPKLINLPLFCNFVDTYSLSLSLSIPFLLFYFSLSILLYTF